MAKPRSKETISKVMSRIKGKDTGLERILRKECNALGIRYRKNSKYIFGHPDISMKGYKVAVFCDSEFWHGYNFEENKEKIHSNTSYWIPKIIRNIERDKEVNEHLEKEGYTVLRFWGEEINKDPAGCAKKIEEALMQKGWVRRKPITPPKK